MQKVLDILSVLVKMLTVSVGGLTATDASLMHLSVEALGAIVTGLGTAGLIIRAFQNKAAAVAK